MDVFLIVCENKDNLSVGFEYSSDLFEETQIIRMARHYMKVLENVLIFPEKKLEEYQLITLEEKNSFLAQFKETENKYLNNQSIQQIFEEQVQANPDAIALVIGDKNITYRQLDNKSNQVAHYLLSMDIKHESLIGISCERSLEFIVGILGILKAGACYVPIDPYWPSARLQNILEKIHSPVLFTQSFSKTILSILVLG